MIIDENNCFEVCRFFLQYGAFGRMASCQIPCPGKLCMDNAPKSIAYITGIGSSAAELLVESQWDSGKRLGCFPERWVQEWPAVLVSAPGGTWSPLQKPGPEPLCQKSLRRYNCDYNHHAVSSPLVTGSVLYPLKMLLKLKNYKMCWIHACKRPYGKSAVTWVGVMWAGGSYRAQCRSISLLDYRLRLSNISIWIFNFYLVQNLWTSNPSCTLDTQELPRRFCHAAPLGTGHPVLVPPNRKSPFCETAVTGMMQTDFQGHLPICFRCVLNRFRPKVSREEMLTHRSVASLVGEYATGQTLSCYKAAWLYWYACNGLYQLRFSLLQMQMMIVWLMPEKLPFFPVIFSLCCFHSTAAAFYIDCILSRAASYSKSVCASICHCHLPNRKWRSGRNRLCSALWRCACCGGTMACTLRIVSVSKSDFTEGRQRYLQSAWRKFSFRSSELGQKAHHFR